MDWRHRAGCRDEDPELWFPVGDDGPARAQIVEAKTVCRRCPVVSACLAWALESGQEAGIWGAKTADERREIRRRYITPQPKQPTPTRGRPRRR